MITIGKLSFSFSHVRTPTSRMMVAPASGLILICPGCSFVDGKSVPPTMVYESSKRTSAKEGTRSRRTILSPPSLPQAAAPTTQWPFTLDWPLLQRGRGGGSVGSVAIQAAAPINIPMSCNALRKLALLCVG